MNTNKIPERIRIRSIHDIRHYLQTYHFKNLADFFIEYESKNRIIKKEEVIKRMKKTLSAMKESVIKGKEHANNTPSGLINGGSKKVRKYIQHDHPDLLGKDFDNLIVNSLAVAELNACMGRIVATPTAGACGVLPGAFLTISEKFSITEESQIDALFIGGGIGELIQINASLSGAQHGCQAEIGSASAITSAVIVALFDPSLDKIENAAAMALSNLLGLVCDPVAGLVEFPCVNRNVIGSVNAVASAQMALAGMRCPIPFDEVVGAMKQIGDDLPASLKETSRGGLAITSTGKKISKEMLNGEPRNPT